MAGMTWSSMRRFQSAHMDHLREDWLGILHTEFVGNVCCTSSGRLAPHKPIGCMLYTLHTERF